MSEITELRLSLSAEDERGIFGRMIAISEKLRTVFMLR